MREPIFFYSTGTSSGSVLSVAVATVVLVSSIDNEYQHAALDAVAAIAAGLDALAGASLWSMSTAEVGRLVVAVERIDRRVSAAQVSVRTRTRPLGATRWSCFAGWSAAYS
jgi:hypothetical protein